MVKKLLVNNDFKIVDVIYLNNIQKGIADYVYYSDICKLFQN